MFSDTKKNRASSTLLGVDSLPGLLAQTAPHPGWVVPGSFGLILGALITYMLTVSSAPEPLLSMEDALGGRMAERVHWSVADVRKDLETMLEECECAPIMLRLAWHDAGTFSKWDGSGGPSGSIRFAPEADHGANAGLAWARDTLEPIRKHHPGISYADLYQLAGVAAVKSTGGPDIEFRPGRPDARLPVDCTPDGRLPGGDKKRDHLRDIFYRMGFDDREIVALSGAHTLGRAHPDRSGFDGAWTEEPLKFDNAYFAVLVGGGKEGLLQLTTDLALMQSPEMEGHVRRYAEDQDVFFSEYAAAHKKLSELGVTWAGEGDGGKGSRA